MRIWWLRGYLNGVLDLEYAGFVTYGECMAFKAMEQMDYPEHNFVVTKGTV